MDSKSNIRRRLAALRQAMAEQNLSAYYIATEDEHLSEYISDHFKFRAWLSGFTGSAGTLIVLLDQAALWTDGRYFLQAEEQLEGTGIQLMKQQIPGVPSITEFLISHLHMGQSVGVDGRTISAKAGRDLSEALEKNDIRLEADADLAETVWKDRPPLSPKKVWLYPKTYAGRAASAKLADLRKKLKELQADAHVICALDEIAWLLNLRGQDVDYNPVFLSYMVLTPASLHLFLHRECLTSEAEDSLMELDVILHPYREIYDFAKQELSGKRILLSPSRTNYHLTRLLEDSGARLAAASDPTVFLKSVKNETEIASTKQAHIKDGLVMVRFMKWLKENVREGCLTEASAAAYLDQLRQNTPGSLGLSFETIAGYGPHGAIVHYAVSPDTDVSLEPHGLFLVDSGGHYLEGTTDITRTFALGPLTPEEKKHFTLVLRCMLNLMYAVFPENVCCHNLDTLARAPLWEHGLDFLHGTGHGVGHLLNVHEGPNNINWKLRPGSSPVPLVPGMITTDEPGVYIEGKYGIRLENELLCQEKETTSYGRFFQFESLTLAPIDLDALDVSLLSAPDRARLNQYHQNVFETLSPGLFPEERDWLAYYTRKI